MTIKYTEGEEITATVGFLIGMALTVLVSTLAWAVAASTWYPVIGGVITVLGAHGTIKGLLRRHRAIDSGSASRYDSGDTGKEDHG